MYVQIRSPRGQSHQHDEASAARDRGLGGPNPRVRPNVIRVLRGDWGEDAVGLADRWIGSIHRSWDIRPGAARCVSAVVVVREHAANVGVHPESVEQWPS